MRVLIVNTYSHIGSTGKITYNLYNYLKENGHQVMLCTRGYPEDKLNDENVIRLNSKFRYWLANIFVGLFGDESVAYPIETRRIKAIINTFKPDVVQLYNLHDYYVNHIDLISFLKKNNIPTVYSMLDEYAYMGKCRFSLDCNKFQGECGACPTRKRHHVIADQIFDWSRKTQKRKSDAYNGFENLVFTGPGWTVDRAKSSSLLKDKQLLLLEEPVNYDDVFYPRNSSELRKKLHIADGVKVILMVGVASTERKGGRYFVELARKFEGNKNYVFVFVGYNRNDWDIPNNMITIGFVKDQNELAEYYSLPDLFVCTSYGDSTPAACLDALGCGSPILGFNIVGIPYCAEEPYGTFVKPFDIDALADVVVKTPFKTEEIINNVRNYAYKRFSTKEVFKKQYNIYETILQKANSMNTIKALRKPAGGG